MTMGLLLICFHNFRTLLVHVYYSPLLGLDFNLTNMYLYDYDLAVSKLQVSRRQYFHAGGVNTD